MPWALPWLARSLACSEFPQTQNVAGQRIQRHHQVSTEAGRKSRAGRDRDSGQEFENQTQEDWLLRPRKNRKPAPEEETNQAAFGEGGPVSGPYGSFSAGGAKGGFGVTGGGGDFGTRFGWYVQVIQKKISENWLKYEVDPKVNGGQRVYITFDVARDGHPMNVRVEQSSGVPSLDVSATRALQRIDTFGPLPPEYNGSKISVEYWFDYSRK